MTYYILPNPLKEEMVVWGGVSLQGRNENLDTGGGPGSDDGENSLPGSDASIRNSDWARLTDPERTMRPLERIVLTPYENLLPEDIETITNQIDLYDERRNQSLIDSNNAGRYSASKKIGLTWHSLFKVLPIPTGLMAAYFVATTDIASTLMHLPVVDLILRGRNLEEPTRYFFTILAGIGPILKNYGIPFVGNYIGGSASRKDSMWNRLDNLQKPVKGDKKLFGLLGSSESFVSYFGMDFKDDVLASMYDLGARIQRDAEGKDITDFLSTFRGYVDEIKDQQDYDLREWETKFNELKESAETLASEGKFPVTRLSSIDQMVDYALSMMKTDFVFGKVTPVAHDTDDPMYKGLASRAAVVKELLDNTAETRQRIVDNYQTFKDAKIPSGKKGRLQMIEMLSEIARDARKVAKESAKRKYDLGIPGNNRVNGPLYPFYDSYATKFEGLVEKLRKYDARLDHDISYHLRPESGLIGNLGNVVGGGLSDSVRNLRDGAPWSRRKLTHSKIIEGIENFNSAMLEKREIHGLRNKINYAVHTSMGSNRLGQLTSALGIVAAAAVISGISITNPNMYTIVNFNLSDNVGVYAYEEVLGFTIGDTHIGWVPFKPIAETYYVDMDDARTIDAWNVVQRGDEETVWELLFNFFAGPYGEVYHGPMFEIEFMPTEGFIGIHNDGMGDLAYEQMTLGPIRDYFNEEYRHFREVISDQGSKLGTQTRIEIKRYMFDLYDNGQLDTVLQAVLYPSMASGITGSTAEMYDLGLEYYENKLRSEGNEDAADELAGIRDEVSEAVLSEIQDIRGHREEFENLMQDLEGNWDEIQAKYPELASSLWISASRMYFYNEIRLSIEQGEEYDGNWAFDLNRFEEYMMSNKNLKNYGQIISITPQYQEMNAIDFGTYVNRTENLKS